MSKIKNYIITLLLIVLISTVIYYKNLNNHLNKELIEVKVNKKEEITTVRDSAYTEINRIISNSNKKFDSIISIPPKIKWIKYEKPVYIDRTLDDALRIHSEYKAYIKTTK